MNRSLRLFAVTVSAGMGLAWSAGAAAWSVLNPCESVPGPAGWTVNSGSAVASIRPGSLGTKSLSTTDRIIFSPLSGSAAFQAKPVVSTDFWTIPVPHSSVPTTDGGENAQFWVNSGGHWYTRSGVGDVDSGVAAPSTWCHVSVQLDYENSKWSLFVDGNLVKDNLSFINNNAPPDNFFNSFEVKSDGGVTVYLDDVSVANNIPSGTLNIPLPSVVAATMNGSALTFTPPVQVGVKYRARGGTDPVNLTAYTWHNGTAIPVPMTGNSYFFKIEAVSELDNILLNTSTETYACYKQARPSGWYYSGVPVGYESGGDPLHSSLAGEAGRQLAKGLTAGGTEDADRLFYKGVQYYLDSNLGWKLYNGGTDRSRESLTPGTGVVIRNNHSEGAAAILVGEWKDNVTSISLKGGWNSLMRPFNTAATDSNCGFPNGAGDMFVVQRPGGPIQAKYAGATKGWVKYNNLQLSDTEWPQGGEGFIYFASADSNYTPSH